MASSKYLRSKDRKIIKSWIKRVERKKQKPKRGLKKLAWKRLKRMRYKKIGCGKKRIVFDLKNGNVLKVAIAVNGIRDIKREAEMYRKAPKKLKKHLAKVKAHGNGWIVMKKWTRKVRKRKGVRKRVKRVQKRFTRRRIRPGDLFSYRRRIRWANIRSGPKRRIIVIDYGNFKFK